MFNQLTILNIASASFLSIHALDWLPRDPIAQLVGITLVILNGIKIYKHLFPKKD